MGQAPAAASLPCRARGGAAPFSCRHGALPHPRGEVGMQVREVARIARAQLAQLAQLAAAQTDAKAARAEVEATKAKV